MLYVLEVNPRASRTVPFVSKATGHAGGQRRRQGHGRRVAGRAGLSTATRFPATSRSRRACFPFSKFAGVDIVLGPEMRSTGEVMGVSERFSIAFAKSQLAAGVVLAERRARIFISVASQIGEGAHGRSGRAGWSRWAFSSWPREGTGRTARSGRHPGASTSRSCKRGIPTCSTI